MKPLAPTCKRGLSFYFFGIKMLAFFLILSWFLLLTFCYGATDTLITGQSINHTQTITSSTGNYQLGFTIPSWHNNNLTYIVIWCKNLKQDPVWVANRENPITDSSTAVLKIGNDGNLIIVDATETTIFWSTNATISPTKTTEAVLLDSGNLILRNRDGEILWQSFDYPTDTLLPGMKLGINLKTGRKWSLSSGEMELGLDLQGEIFAWKNGVPQWRGGYWNGESFNGLTEMTRSENSYNYRFTRNENEIYFSYNSSVLSRLVLFEAGQLKQFALVEDGELGFWNLSWLRRRSTCQDYGVCGVSAVSSCEDDAWTLSCRCLQGLEPIDPKGWGGGCWRETVLECGKEFVALVRMKLPDRGVERRAGDCETECRSNCSCVGYAVVDSRCLVWSGDLIDLQQFDGEGEGEVFYLRIRASSKQGGAKNKLLMIVAIAIFGSIFLLSGMFLFWRQASKRGIRRSRELMLQDLGIAVTTRKNSTVANMHGDSRENTPELLLLFNLHIVTAATENFCIANKLGEGGFGPVYKGRLSKGEEIAVKRLSRHSTQGLEEFKNEIALIAKLQHKNLVRLLGCCIQEEEKMLIYEYMPNKSLDLFLFDEWWRNFGIDDLELQTLAIRILSQTCSSSGCERNWSVFERIHTKRRNRLEHKRLNDLVYTHYNLRLKERQASRKSLTDPISLENIDLTDDWVVEAEDDDAPLLDVDEIDDWMDVADAILDEGEGGAAADPAKRTVLDWGKSFSVIEGIAQGLLYLHRYSRLRIIHRDLKASNILLDGDMNPKISDFGMARIFEANQNQANTERVIGTLGYMSPEYALDGRFSEKSDVYSFGVLLLEIISGKRNTGVYHSEQPRNLIGYSWRMWNEGRESELLDPSLGDSCRTNEVLKCIHIGLLCVQEDPEDRPTMSSIVFMLGSEITPSPAPKQPAFSRGQSSIETSSCSSRSRSSINEVLIEPR